MARFRKKPVIVDAVRAKNRFTVVTEWEAVLRGKPGAWLITGVDGEQQICGDDLFRATYEPVNDEARRMMGGE